MPTARSIGADWSGDCGNGKKMTCLAVLDPEDERKLRGAGSIAQRGGPRRSWLLGRRRTSSRRRPTLATNCHGMIPSIPARSPWTKRAACGSTWRRESAIPTTARRDRTTLREGVAARIRRQGRGCVRSANRQIWFCGFVLRITRIMFSTDKDNTLYFSVQRDGGIGWLNVRHVGQNARRREVAGLVRGCPGNSKARRLWRRLQHRGRQLLVFESANHAGKAHPHGARLESAGDMPDGSV